MTADQFKHLDEMEQIEAIWEAKKVAEREDSIYRYTLYQIDSFYVEEHWHKEYDVRRAFESFTSDDELIRPYLGKIGVSKFL